MRSLHVFAAANAAALLGALALLIGAGGTIYAAAEGLHALRQQYRRPAVIPFPKDNAYSFAKDGLGRMLFFDPILSGSKVRSCASCHNSGLSWSDGQPHAIGARQLPRDSGLRTPTLLNRAGAPTGGGAGP